jgi:hypothetical protein
MNRLYYRESNSHILNWSCLHITAQFLLFSFFTFLTLSPTMHITTVWGLSKKTIFTFSSVWRSSYALVHPYAHQKLGVSGNVKAQLTHGGHIVHLHVEPIHSSQHHHVPGRGTQPHLLAFNIKHRKVYKINSQKYHEGGGKQDTIGAK